ERLPGRGGEEAGAARRAAVSVTVFGTGALGCWVAGRLAQTVPVAVVGTWVEGLEAIRGRGIRVDEPQGRLQARPQAVQLGRPLPPAEFVLVLVKSHQTASVAVAAAAAAQPAGRIVTLQNGLGNREALQAADHGGRVRAGVVVAGARLTAPATVTVVPGPVTLESAGDPAMARLAAVMAAAGFETRRVDDIEPELWRKVAINCAINPLSALHGLPNGALLEDEGLRATLRAAAAEVEAVAAARGVPLREAAAAAEAIARGTASNRSSMLQDLDRGARTEIDALCGAVVREARRLGLPAPVNERLWREVRAREGRPVDLGATA
ncbi:MAG TPA: ketopantoate reductase family protein, partial [Vicinamibacteria bacterium]|nr:ketopantoate reductase family protein [Vicinamibacteria bacterium]